MVDTELIETSAHEIIPNLWVGNQAASQDLEFLERCGIGLIINVSNDIPFTAHYQAAQLRIPVKDRREPRQYEIMKENLPGALRQIHEALNKGVPVLVHCHSGAQRSPFVVLMYLLLLGHGFDEAKNKILQLRPRAFNRGRRINFHPVYQYYSDIL